MPFQVFVEEDLSARGQRNTNLEWEEKVVEVVDFRDDEDYYDIDNHGFTYRILKDFWRLENTQVIEDFYIPAVRELLQREIYDAGTVFVYDWRVCFHSVAATTLTRQDKGQQHLLCGQSGQF
jgi:hypothetical protein